MKESQIAGLMELRKEYTERLKGLKDYQELSKELDAKSLNLIKTAVEKAHIKPDLSPALVLADEDGCGFCSECITSCTGCVFHVAS